VTGRLNGLVTMPSQQLAVPPEMLERAAELLEVLHTIERRVAGTSALNESDRIEEILAGVDPVEVREIQTVLSAFATLNRRAAA
jgi:hypothetical protein